MGHDMNTSDMLERLADEHRATLEAIQGFEAEDFEQALPGSTWSVRDVFAHLAIGNIDAMRALDQIARRRAVSFSTDDAHDAADEKAVGKRRTLPLQKVMEEFRRSHRDLMEASRRMPEAGWRRHGTTAGGNPIDATAIVNHVAEHYARHRDAVVKAIDRS